MNTESLPVTECYTLEGLPEADIIRHTVRGLLEWLDYLEEEQALRSSIIVHGNGSLRLEVMYSMPNNLPARALVLWQLRRIRELAKNITA